MLKLESVEQIKGVYDNVEIDWDRYNFVGRSPVATKEYSVDVDFLNEEVKSDCIKYGSWYKLEKEECIEILKLMLIDHEPKRDFPHTLLTVWVLFS